MREEFISTESCFKLTITRISKSKLELYSGGWNFCTKYVTFVCFEFEQLYGHGKEFILSEHAEQLTTTSVYKKFKRGKPKFQVGKI